MSAKRRWKASKAIVANDARGNGIVLWAMPGSLLAEQIHQIDNSLGSLGLDDAPAGVSVWEGDFVWRPGGYECPEDGELDPIGTFRTPTDSEWNAVRDGRSPWAKATKETP